MFTKLFTVTLNHSHQPTGNTRHWIGDALLPTPAALEIVGEESGFLLLYLDESGNEQTDTWHQSVEDAFAQAQFEFGVHRGDWIAS